MFLQLKNSKLIVNSPAFVVSLGCFQFEALEVLTGSSCVLP